MLKRLLTTAGLLLLLTAALNHQAISDWWTLRSYEPPAEIVALAEKASLSPTGEKLFYVSTPLLTDGAEFSTACPKGGHGFVLGCYVNGKIFILRPTMAELENIKQVTAAHEMLHAAYARLSNRERTRINALLEAEFAQVDEERVLELMAQYERESPEAFHDELHSVLPTQVETLSDELEEYYRRYFHDRSVVIAAYQSYEAVFAEIRTRVTALSNQIDSLKAQIAELGAKITAQEAQLRTMRAQLDSYQANGQIEQHNALVPTYNQGVNRVRALVTEHNRLVDVLDGLVKEHNELVLYEADLIDSLDSTKLTPQN